MPERHDLVPTSLAIMAMRDNGYRNTSYAIAELIDNAVQAGASSVELLCCERQFFVQQRTRRNVHQVAVLDDGQGMRRCHSSFGAAVWQWELLERSERYWAIWYGPSELVDFSVSESGSLDLAAGAGDRTVQLHRPQPRGVR